MNFKFRILIFLSIITFISCESEQKIVSETKQKATSTINEKENIIFSIDSSEGHHICYISKIINEIDTSILVDFVNYLTGINAHKASIIDGNYEIDNGDTITDITNDYYISNKNNKLRKFKISSNSEIFIYDYEMDGEFKEISITNFLNRNKENIDFFELYNITYKNGKTKVLEELFVP